MDTNNFLKQMLLMGIGTTSFVADKIREVSEEWVKEGRLNPDQAKAFVDAPTLLNGKANFSGSSATLCKTLGWPVSLKWTNCAVELIG
jgi:hypothetical protein